MKKTFLLAVLAILLVGGGAILAVLYFTDSSPSVTGGAGDAQGPGHSYDPAMPGPTGPTGSADQRQPPPNLKSPAGVPMVPQDDPRAEKMEAQRAQKFESAMDAQNRRAQERIRKAGKQPLPPPPPVTPGRPPAN
jgi:hypothetical protein